MSRYVRVYGRYRGQLGYHFVSEEVIGRKLREQHPQAPPWISWAPLGQLWQDAGRPAPDGRPFDDSGDRGFTVTTCDCGHSRALHAPFGGCCVPGCACGAPDLDPCHLMAVVDMGVHAPATAPSTVDDLLAMCRAELPMLTWQAFGHERGMYPGVWALVPGARLRVAYIKAGETRAGGFEASLTAPGSGFDTGRTCNLRATLRRCAGEAQRSKYGNPTHWQAVGDALAALLGACTLCPECGGDALPRADDAVLACAACGWSADSIRADL